MNTKLIAAVLILLTALAGTAYGAVQLSQNLREAKAQVHALSARVAAVEAHVKSIQTNVNSTIKRSQQHGQEIKTALAAVQPWAAAPVPPVISDGLCKFARCATAGEVRAPTDRPKNK